MMCDVMQPSVVFLQEFLSSLLIWSTITVVICRTGNVNACSVVSLQLFDFLMLVASGELQKITQRKGKIQTLDNFTSVAI